MKKLIYLIISLSLIGASADAQDTFSIIAVDTITSEIGGAGASCIDESAIPGGVLIINDIIPGRGGIHTQSYWHSANQQNAHNRMMEGMSPQEIIDWLVANDVQNNPGVRQYGIVDFSPFGNPRSAAFTGTGCLNYKNHIAGRNYAIQGNILLGQQILDSIESRFLNTEGSLAEKLMAALQGANVPGADTRCLNEGTSSLSAFVRVAQTGDTLGTFWCDLLVPSTPYGVEPIDSLQVLFDEWMIWTGIEDRPFIQPNRAKIFPNPATDQIIFEIAKTGEIKKFNIQVVSISGQVVEEFVYENDRVILNTTDYPSGLYLYRVYHNKRILDIGKFSVKK